ncbi:arylalkylamine N-acetyltransferase 1 isoform X2 [Temnothorax nylanderi]|uniref:arylalkylamine N-acetyltransferase 1 isoform X2 n=1 Tax=Temnothorax nylanderi TaxID=102681 RepID=UPI003A8434AF
MRFRLMFLRASAAFNKTFLRESPGRIMPACLGTDRTGALEFRMLTKDRIEDVLTVQQYSMRQECIAIGMGMYEDPGAPEEMQLVFREVIKDGCTVIAVDRSDRVVAVAFNKLHVPPQPEETDPLALFIESNIKHRSCRDLIEFIDDIESRVDVFEKYNARSAMEIFYIGTDPKCQERGIGLEITEKSLEVARGLRARKLKQICVADKIVNEYVRPEVAFAVAASMFSQRIMEKLNFETLAEVRYEDYIRGGKKMSDRIGNVHKTAKLTARKL